MSDLVASQGVRFALQDLSEEVFGIYFRGPSIGSLVIVRPDDQNAGPDDDSGRLRFSLMHGYGLALFETEQSVLISTLAGADQLSEIRADAFAAAFLLPRSGLEAAIAGMDKGRPSRRALAVFGVAAEEAAEVVVRSAPGSQTLTCHNVAVIAQRFGVSYGATVHRLRALDMISKSETADLLSERARQAAALARALLLAPDDGQAYVPDEATALKSEIALLALEAYRRELIAKADLNALAAKLKLPGLTPARLLVLGDAAS